MVFGLDPTIVRSLGLFLAFRLVLEGTRASPPGFVSAVKLFQGKMSEHNAVCVLSVSPYAK